MKVLLSALIACAVTMPVFADETMGEKAKATANDAKLVARRSAKNLKHATCTKGDAKCAAERAKDDAVEAAKTTGEKIEEGVNKVD